MKDVKIYQLGSKNKIYLLDISMNDSVNSHRYYFLNIDGDNVSRITSINHLLQYISSKNGSIKRLSTDELLAASFAIKTFIDISRDRKKLQRPYKIGFETPKDQYPGLSDTHEPDYSLITESINDTGTNELRKKNI